MKKCHKCGAIQSDDRFYCVDCNERLKDRIPDDEAKLIEKELEDRIENLKNGAEPLHVSSADKIVGFASLIGINVIIVFLIIFRSNLGKVPESVFSIYSIFLFVLCSVTALVPKIGWALDKFRLHFIVNNADDAQPSDFYRAARKISIYFCFTCALFLMVFSLLNLMNPPI
ncbi:MAG: hypothetical protein LBM60_06465 [Clostridium sp.]|jgi:hypothetical protein|nr:hypothetical protein [Clostridium sp.]